MTRKILVTGAGGFIGQHLLRLLVEAGLEVHALYRTPPRDSVVSRGASRYVIDLLTQHGELDSLLKRLRPTDLLHLAWYARPEDYWTSRENFQWVAGSMDLVQRFVGSGGRRIVIAGTCAEYDWRYGFCSETLTPLAPTSTYGIAKDSTRRMVEAYLQDTDVNLAWARIFFVYGPGEHPSRFIPSLSRSLLEGSPATCEQGSLFRDFLHVTDVASALSKILASDVSGAINIGSGVPVRLADIASRLAHVVGATERLKIASDDRPDSIPLLVADVSRLRSEVGWWPMRTLDQGLLDTLGWWKTEGGEASQPIPRT
jgi:nucleoside-diphosphate-sugar epimerase